MCGDSISSYTHFREGSMLMIISSSTVKPALKAPLYNKSLSTMGSLIFPINE